MTSYVSSADQIRADQLTDGFFEGWSVKPMPQRHLEILQRSFAVEIALDEGEVIGFATAISDSVMSAYVPLLEVLPGHRGSGIGSELIRRLLARLGGLYMVDLSCDADLQSFYERLGFSVLDRAMGQRRPESLG